MQEDNGKNHAIEEYKRSLLNIFRTIWMTDKFHEDETNTGKPDNSVTV